jgi:D-serine deaminase-like pyridoxal phosphate-dependent protein
VHIDEVATPQVLVDRRRLAANITRMQDAARAAGLRLRPHAKTHKSPRVAGLQVDGGAAGICCAKLGEAEVFAAAGIEDIRLPYPLQPSNAARVFALASRVRLSFIVDHPEVASAWSEAVRARGRTLDVLVKVDVGFHRCGVDPGSPLALALIEQVDRSPGLRLLGLLSHAGHAYHATSEAELAAVARRECETLLELSDRARRAGIELEEVSVGATPPVRFSLHEPGLTELRPGNYVYYDRTQVGLGAAAVADCALTVLSTVVSRPSPERVVLDAGSKTLSSDPARGFTPLPGHGWVLPDAVSDRVDETLLIERLSEEHATVRVTSGSCPLKPGDRVRLLPNHSCVVSNLVDEVLLVEDGLVVDTMQVAARGKIT